VKVEIVFYELENGEEPVQIFLDSLDNKMSAKIVRNIQLLSELGPELRMPFSEYIGDGIFELRTQQGNDISRILYFFFFGKRAILTNGLIKKTNKLPKKALELAKKYKKDYERRYRNGKL
jgi:phage-related protein